MKIFLSYQKKVDQLDINSHDNTRPYLCSGSGESGKGKMAVVISTLNNPWFVILGESAATKARELGYEAVIYDSQNNLAWEAD